MKTSKASLKKRLLAFLIDMIIIVVILFLFELIFPQNKNVVVLKQELNNTTEVFFNKQITLSIYFNQAALIFKDLDKARVAYSIINAILIFIYFIFIPYFWNGLTVGKKIMKIRTVRNDKDMLTMKNLVIKNMIDTGLLYMLVSLALIYTLPAISYCILSICLSLLQVVLIIVSVVMIIKRKDKRGLNDILSGTKVIEDNIEVKE